MNYPLISEYVQSIKLAEENLDKLSNLSPVLDADGAPVMSSGNFAVVFKMKDRQTGKFYAVKCFLREQESRDESYKLIASELEYVSSTFLTPIKYLEKELFVDTTQSSETEFPVLLMDWVEGLTLDKYIRNHLDDTYRLSLAAYQFCRMGAWLLSQEFAHGDLKPDNIIVKADGQLVLIDYDGMFVPAMHGRKARETGSADYRHPLRSEEVFNANIDDFSIASIALSLKAISLNPALLEEFGADDRLLFSAKDYQNISDSECMKAVARLAHDRELSQLLGLFYIAYARNELNYVSFKLLNMEKPEYIPVVELEIEFSTEVTKEDLVDAVVDEYGVKYSKDGVKLLRVPQTIRSYKVREKVQIICDRAFSGCSSLRELVLPDSVTSIGDIALYECESLRELVLPDSVTSIGNSAFGGCNSLGELILPDSVTSIGGGAFQECDILHIISHNPMFGVVDDCLLIDNINHRLISCYNCKEYVAIPDSVTSIGDDAFSGCSSLYELVLPGSVTSIGRRAFDGCSSLRELVLPDSVTSIGDWAFRGCSSLRELVLPDSMTSIGNNAFSGCSSLCELALPDSVTSIGDWAFSGCSSLCELALPDSVTSIGKNAFWGCNSLCELILPDSVTSIGDGAFQKCNVLHVISHNPMFSVVHDCLLIDNINHRLISCYNCKEYVAIPDSVTSIGDDAFSGCSSLHELVLPGSVTSIGDDAFSGCSSLYELVLPDSVTSIGGSAFDGCSSLRELILPDSVPSIGDGMFASCSSLRELVLPDSVPSIGDCAFSGCKSLRELVLPGSVTSIGDCAFSGCKSLCELVLPGSVTSIGRRAFDGCSSLHELVLPSSVTSIGDDAFSGCSSLRELVLPDSVTSIGGCVFHGCDVLHIISHNPMFSVVDDWLLIDNTNHRLISCYNRKECVTIPDSVLSIGDRAFSGCKSLRELVLPDSVTNIGNRAFWGCESLRELVLPGSVKSIGDEAFSRCSSLHELVIPDSVTSIGDSTFRGCKSLRRVVIPDSVKSIGAGAFRECSSLASIIVPKNQTQRFKELLKDSGCDLSLIKEQDE